MSSAAASSPRAWIAAALREGVASPLPDHVSADELVAVAEEEGMLPLLDQALRRQSGEAPALREVVVPRNRFIVAESLFAAHEVRRVTTALAAAEIRALLLKGRAFALWLYPQPTLRMCGDIDILVATRDDADRVARVLDGFGYVHAFAPGSMTYEMSCRLEVDGRMRSEVDVHCRLVNAPAFAECLRFDELWEASMALPDQGKTVRGLSPVHSLLHACLHRAHDLGLQRPVHLKWLYDLHLLSAALDEDAWNEVLELARARGLCGVCLDALQATDEAFGVTAPEGVWRSLRSGSADEVLDHRRLADWRYMQWQHLKALPDMRSRLRWLREKLVPTDSHLQELHGADAPRPVLLWRRLMRALERLRNRG